MGNLTVYFVGICTHLREMTSRQVEHRVVLVNADREPLYINDWELAPHKAVLRYPGSDGKPKLIDLNGVRITVNAEKPDVVTYEDSFFLSVWRLTKFAPNLPPLSLQVARDGNKDFSAAHFDAAGHFSGGIDKNNASVAVLHVVTDGAPRVRIQPFDGSEPTDLTDLPEGARIQIENVGPGAPADQKADFLINFMVAQAIPKDVTWPEVPPDVDVIELPFPANTVDPGCSNSNYP